MKKILFAMLLLPLPVLADVMNLEAGLPTEIEDAKAGEPGTWELQPPARFERDRQSKNLFSIEPRVQGGFEGGWQFSAAIPVIAGSGDKTLKLYQGHFHDLLADTGKETVMADIRAWIDRHLPA